MEKACPCGQAFSERKVIKDLATRDCRVASPMRPAYGSKLIARARLISRVILRCNLAETPVMRRGRILPVSVVNLDSKLVSLNETFAG